MKVPVFKAKDVDSNDVVEGFYFEYPLTNSFAEVAGDSNIVTANIAHCILTYKPGLMGVINEPTGCTIDLATLEFVKFVDVPCQEPTLIKLT